MRSKKQLTPHQKVINVLRENDRGDLLDEAAKIAEHMNNFHHHQITWTVGTVLMISLRDGLRDWTAANEAETEEVTLTPEGLKDAITANRHVH